MGTCLIPAVMFLCNRSSAQKLPLALLVSHYAYRSFIYPFWLQQPKQTPLHVWLAACGFITYNSVLQVLGKLGTHFSAAQHCICQPSNAKQSPNHIFNVCCCNGTSSCSCGNASSSCLERIRAYDCHIGISPTITCRAHSWCTVSVS